MKRTLLLLATIIFCLSACRKNDTPVAPDPEARFALATAYSANDTSQLITTATDDGFSVTNTSANADAYLWDFGNGTTSTDKNPGISYSQPGTYTVTLTAITKDGRKSATGRTIKVLNRVAKQIVVRSLNAQSALGWASVYPKSDKLNLWVEILQAAPNQQYPLSSFGVPQAPLVYKTEVANNIDASALPLSFTVSNKLIISLPVFGSCCGYSGLGYIFNLYAQNNTGTYLITSSYGSGVGFTMSGDIRHNRFEITTGFEGSNVSLNGDYE